MPQIKKCQRRIGKQAKIQGKKAHLDLGRPQGDITLPKALNSCDSQGSEGVKRLHSFSSSIAQGQRSNPDPHQVSRPLPFLINFPNVSPA